MVLLDNLRMSLRNWAPVLGAKRNAAAAPTDAPAIKNPATLVFDKFRILDLLVRYKIRIAPEQNCGKISPTMIKRAGILIFAAVLMTALAFGLQRSGSVTTKSSPFSEQRAAVHLDTIVG